MLKVGISYGWSEGSWHGKRLRQQLREGGFSITRNLRKADLIIAHSGGCFLLPRKTRAQVIMFVGRPHWPGREPWQNLPAKIQSELKDIWWFKKTIANGFYLFLRMPRWIRMWYAWKKADTQDDSGKTIVTIRNEQDAFLNPVDSDVFYRSNGWHHHVLPGGHDDLWEHPEPYVELLEAHKASLNNR